MKKLFALLLALLILSGCAAPIPGETRPAPEPSVTAPSETVPEASSQPTEPSQSSPETDPSGPDIPSGEALTVHFIDVGQADAILLTCPGGNVLIDGGNVADSSLMVSYLLKQGVEELDLVVGTHAHEDHIGGLAGVLAVFPTKDLWVGEKTYSSRAFDNFRKYAEQQDLELRVPKPGETRQFGRLELTVLGPVTVSPNHNNNSVVIMAQYGDHKFLFTGDMEQEEEQDLLNSGVSLKADVLKVGHHGSHTSTGYHFLYEVDPDYAVISCGWKNDYGHPHEEPLSRLQDCGAKIFRTDTMGTVTVVSDGKNLTFTQEKDGSIPKDPEPPKPGQVYYIGNLRSHVLHRPDCETLPARKNRVIYYDYDQAIKDGFRPCHNCMGN